MLRSAPAAEDDRFRVPRILDEEVSGEALPRRNSELSA